MRGLPVSAQIMLGRPPYQTEAFSEAVAQEKPAQDKQAKEDRLLEPCPVVE